MPFRGRAGGQGILSAYTVKHSTIYSSEKQARDTPLVTLENRPIFSWVSNVAMHSYTRQLKGTDKFGKTD